MMSNSVKMKLAAGLFVPAVALAGAAFAQSDKATTGTPSATTGAPASGMVDKEALFKRLDTNNDGMLSAAEAQKDSKVGAAWKDLDAGNKGSISKADFLAGYDKK
jgi:hypothetical protein